MRGGPPWPLALLGVLALASACAAVLLNVARAEGPPPQRPDESAAASTGPQDPQQGGGDDGAPELGPNAYKDLDKPHLLAGSFYSLRDGLSATLLLNNKGPRPLEVTPTLFGLGGQRLDIAPVVVGPNSFRMIDLREWAQAGGPPFEAGSIQLFHKGRDLVLGSQIYLTDEAHSLSFDEKLTEITNGGPTRLEGVWWVPPTGAEVSLALSNTSGAALAVTAGFHAEGRNQKGVVVYDLGPHETRLVSVPQESARGASEGGRADHARKARVGAVSLAHDGAGGSLVARAMVQDRGTGYSSSVQLSSPAASKSSRLEGVGLRLLGGDGERLTPVVVARNVGDAPAVLGGRVAYSGPGDAVGFVQLPKTRLAPGEAKIVEAARAFEKNPPTAGAAVGGLELEYTGGPGALAVSAHSMSGDGNQVYRVPLWDPLAQRSPTGGYPWSIEGDSSTVVYIKNITDRPQTYIARLMYGDGGQYGFALREVRPHQTATIDVRELRDRMVPDEKGRTLPPDVTRGQIMWSLRPSDDPADDADPYAALALLGRSEQTSFARAVSSSYSCMNCCGDIYTDGRVLPGPAATETGYVIPYTAEQRNSDCYGGWGPYHRVNASWSTSNTSVATVQEVDEIGWVTTRQPGNVEIRAKWTMYRGIENPCEPDPGIYSPAPAPDAEEEPRPNLPGCGDCTMRSLENTSSSPLQVVPVVRVLSSVICEDRITILLQPSNVSGQLTVYLDGPQGSFQLATRSQQGGQTTQSFNVPSLPNGREFTRVRATWTVSGVTATGTDPYHMVVLGDYLQTCYNVPFEGDFDGNVVTAGISTSSCQWSSDRFFSRFLDEVNENGSGVDSTGRQMQIEGVCGSAPGSSPAYCDAYGYSCSRYRRPTDIRSSCNTPLDIDYTVARGPGSSLACNTPVYIHGIGCRTVEDRGGGLANDQLDNYKGVGAAACAGWPSVRRKTIKLF